MYGLEIVYLYSTPSYKTELPHQEILAPLLKFREVGRVDLKFFIFVLLENNQVILVQDKAAPRGKPTPLLEFRGVGKVRTWYGLKSALENTVTRKRVITWSSIEKRILVTNVLL